MTRIRRAARPMLWALQWSLAFTLFVLGLLETGLRPEDLGLEGLIQALAAMALVIPSATGFWPRLSPLVAAIFASILATGAVAPFAPVGLASPLADLALAAGCAVVAVGRSFLLPVSPVDLGPEAVDSFARPPARPSPLPAGHPERVGDYQRHLAAL
jgi:hypothetical protein